MLWDKRVSGVTMLGLQLRILPPPPPDVRRHKPHGLRSASFSVVPLH